MVGIALIREEYSPELQSDDKVCVGVFKTYESALIAMAENRREWKAANDVHYEDEKSLSLELAEYSGTVSMNVIYEMIPVQKIEA